MGKQRPWQSYDVDMRTTEERADDDDAEANEEPSVSFDPLAYTERDYRIDTGKEYRFRYEEE